MESQGCFKCPHCYGDISWREKNLFEDQISCTIFETCLRLSSPSSTLLPFFLILVLDIIQVLLHTHISKGGINGFRFLRVVAPLWSQWFMESPNQSPFPCQKSGVKMYYLLCNFQFVENDFHQQLFEFFSELMYQSQTRVEETSITTD